MQKKSRNIWKVLLCVPFLLGTIGFLQAGEHVVDALFISLCMYGMEVQDPTPNLWVELARWAAPLATASGILLLFSSARRTLYNLFRFFMGDSVAVYGPEEEKTPLLDQLGRKGIDGGNGFVRARQYILLNCEEENFAFYEQNRKVLENCPVYLQCSSLRAQDSSAPNLHLVCSEETAARLFWKRRRLYKTSVQNGHKMRIVFLGFGKLGEELLIHALQDNIFHPQQRIEYHIFHEDASFSAIRRQLDSIGDPIIFHAEPWYEQLELIEQAQAVAVLTQEAQLALLQNLLLSTIRGDIDVFAASNIGVELLDMGERLNLFHWRQESRKLDHILGETLFEQAKRINLRYASLYSHVPETEEAKEAEWNKLSAFVRYSNISAADYHEIRLDMLKGLGESMEAEQLSPECMELLAELEHIRWCRYHYLNNWRYGALEDGKNKDTVQRIHRDLLPYGKLTESEKEKDRENVRILLSFQ